MPFRNKLISARINDELLEEFKNIISTYSFRYNSYKNEIYREYGFRFNIADLIEFALRDFIHKYGDNKK